MILLLKICVVMIKILNDEEKEQNSVSRDPMIKGGGEAAMDIQQQQLSSADSQSATILPSATPEEALAANDLVSSSSRDVDLVIDSTKEGSGVNPVDVSSSERHRRMNWFHRVISNIRTFFRWILLPYGREPRSKS